MKQHVSAFSVGLWVPWRGAQILCCHRSLWPAALLVALVYCVGLGLGIAGFSAVWFWGWGYVTLGAWYWDVLGVLLLLGVSLVVGLLILLLVVNLFVGMALERLALRTEQVLGDFDKPVEEQTLLVQAVDATLDTGRMIGLSGLAFVLSFLPIVGWAMALVVEAVLLGEEIWSYPLVLRSMSRKQRYARLKTIRPATMATGLPLVFVGWIPILSSVWLACSVVGVVAGYRKVGFVDE